MHFDSARLPALTIVIADDDRVSRTLMIHLISEQFPQARIITVRDGDEALKLCLSQHVDLLITDHLMPRMDGLTLLNRLVQLQRKPLTLMVTGANLNLMQAHHAGVDILLIKPWSIETFVQALEDVMALL